MESITKLQVASYLLDTKYADLTSDELDEFRKK